ncbi:MAG: PAS domain S-box protein, partial [Synergistota bacterium]|nr:PAS domain S-box protein [Synergistota bacterium]
MPKKSEPHSLVGIQHIRLLVENAPEGMVLCDRSNRITYANRVFCEMFGYALEEAMGKYINSIVSRSAPVRKEAEQVASNILEQPYVLENTIRENRRGEPVPVSILAGPIHDNGKLVGAYGVYRDISERKIMETNIQRERVFFEKLFSDTPIAIL